MTFLDKPGPEVQFVAYTDGSYVLPRNVGASACVILEAGGEKRKVYEWSEVSSYSTTQRQELKAIIQAISKVPEGSAVMVYSDSENGIGVLAGGLHSRRDTDLVEMYHKVRRERGLRVYLEWIRSHTGNEWNEYADQLCIDALQHYEQTGCRLREDYF